MSKKISADDLTGEVTKIYKTYSDEVKKKVDSAIVDTAKKTQAQIPSYGDFKDQTGRYRKGWQVTIEKTPFGQTAIIHNSVYQLTHLLEYGHADRGGGRVRAYPHIDQAEDYAVELLEDEIVKAIEESAK